MKRRQFLKSVFGVVAGLVAVPSVVKANSLLRTEEEHAEVIRGAMDRAVLNEFDIGKIQKQALLGDGLENAFCYGGRLFRVYPGYFREGLTRMRLRGGQFHNREFNYVLRDEDFNNREYRNNICETMLKVIDN